MQYRIVISERLMRAQVIPVPLNHRKGKRVFIHQYAGRRVYGYMAYRLYGVLEAAVDHARALLNVTEERDKERYKRGDMRPREAMYPLDEDTRLIHRLERRGKQWSLLNKRCNCGQ
jgi:hypothetical protein